MQFNLNADQELFSIQQPASAIIRMQLVEWSVVAHPVVKKVHGNLHHRSLPFQDTQVNQAQEELVDLVEAVYLDNHNNLATHNNQDNRHTQACPVNPVQAAQEEQVV